MAKKTNVDNHDDIHVQKERQSYVYEGEKNQIGEEYDSNLSNYVSTVQDKKEISVENTNEAKDTVYEGLESSGRETIPSSGALSFDTSETELHAVATGAEDTAISLNIQSTSSDGAEIHTIQISDVPEGAELSAGTNIEFGTWSLAPEDLVGLTITPPEEFSGSFELTVTAQSVDGISVALETEMIDVVVSDVNDGPVAVDDQISGFEDTVISGNVLTNDSDIDGKIEVENTGDFDTEHGSITVKADGTYEYTPDADYKGSDNFEVTIVDDDGATSTSTLNITINDAVEANVVSDDDSNNIPTITPDIDQKSGSDGSDNLSNNHSNDLPSDGSGGDVLKGGTGDDRLSGGDGDDRLVGGSGDDRLSGGAGDDVLKGGSGDDRMSGGSGDDVLQGGSGDDRLSGGAGDDVLKGGSGDDRLSGGDGDDRLVGGSGDDRLSGGSGDDVLQGGSGDDRLSGGDGDDHLIGGDGDDYLSGGDGSDHLEFMANMGNDTADGGAGGDWMDTLELDGFSGGDVGEGWTLVLDNGSTVVSSETDGELLLSGDASGTITFDDGGSIDFDNMEKIVW